MRSGTTKANIHCMLSGNRELCRYRQQGEYEGARDQIEEFRWKEGRKAEGWLEPARVWAEHGVVQR